MKVHFSIAYKKSCQTKCNPNCNEKKGKNNNATAHPGGERNVVAIPRRSGRNGKNNSEKMIRN